MKRLVGLYILVVVNHPRPRVPRPQRSVDDIGYQAWNTRKSDFPGESRVWPTKRLRAALLFLSVIKYWTRTLTAPCPGYVPHVKPRLINIVTHGGAIRSHDMFQPTKYVCCCISQSAEGLDFFYFSRHDTEGFYARGCAFWSKMRHNRARMLVIM